jgi:hypothetical protein
MTENEIADWLAKKVDADLFRAMAGPQPPKRQTALRMRGGRFETVELDDAGNAIEPEPRCCSGQVLHAPNCKYWLTAT